MLPILVVIGLAIIFFGSYLIFYKNQNPLTDLKGKVFFKISTLYVTSDIPDFSIITNSDALVEYASKNNLYKNGQFTTIFGNAKQVRVNITPDSLAEISDYSLIIKIDGQDRKMLTSTGKLMGDTLFIEAHPEEAFLSDLTVSNEGLGKDVHRSRYINQLIFYYLYAYDINTANLALQQRTDKILKFATYLLVNSGNKGVWPVFLTKIEK